MSTPVRRTSVRRTHGRRSGISGGGFSAVRTTLEPMPAEEWDDLTEFASQALDEAKRRYKSSEPSARTAASRMQSFSHGAHDFDQEEARTFRKAAKARGVKEVYEDDEEGYPDDGEAEYGSGREEEDDDSDSEEDDDSDDDKDDGEDDDDEGEDDDDDEDDDEEDDEGEDDDDEGEKVEDKSIDSKDQDDKAENESDGVAVAGEEYTDGNHKLDALLAKAAAPELEAVSATQLTDVNVTLPSSLVETQRLKKKEQLDVILAIEQANGLAPEEEPERRKELSKLKKPELADKAWALAKEFGNFGATATNDGDADPFADM